MPVRRRIDKRRAEVTDEMESWLHGDDKASGFVQYAPDDELAALWAAHSDRIVAEHVTHFQYPARLLVAVSATTAAWNVSGSVLRANWRNRAVDSAA